MPIFKGLNLALAFLLELALVGAAGYVGLALAGGWAGWLLAGVLALAVMLIWARWAAPRSRRRLTGGGLLAFKACLFVVAALGLALSGLTWLGVALIVVVAINLGLAQAWDQVTA